MQERVKPTIEKRLIERMQQDKYIQDIIATYLETLEEPNASIAPAFFLVRGEEKDQPDQNPEKTQDEA